MRRSLLSLFIVFVVFSAVFLSTAAYWFIQQCYSARSTRVSILFQEKLLRQTHPSLINDTWYVTSGAKETTADQDLEYIGHSIDLQLFTSWRQGVVTLLESQIPKNCAALFNGTNQTEISRVTEANQNWNSTEYDQKFATLFIDSEHCEKIRAEFDGNLYTSDEELSFPLAFSMNIHKDPQQIVRLLKFIYRSHNVYCIHYDQKSSNEVKKVFNTLDRCLQNVIVPKRIVRIVYGCYPILDAQLSCLSALLKLRRRYPWKYVTTMCGRELPLRTNREMVRFLKRMKGLPVVYTSEFTSQEYSQKFHYANINTKGEKCNPSNKFQSNPVPYGMKLFKTMAYFCLTPDFTDFILHSTEARALYEFVKPILSPEEAFYGTLLHYWNWSNRTDETVRLPQVHVSDTIWLSWQEIGKGQKTHCSGSNIHRVCIVSSGDLHRLKYSTDPDYVRPPLFHNKYNMAEDHTVMDCMEELLVERNKQEYIRDMQIVAVRQGLLDRTVSGS